MTDITENPFDHGVTAELVADLSSPIGFVTINWSFIEQYMASIIETTSEVVAAAGAAVKRDRQYGEKLKYLRKVFSSVEALKKHQARADHIFAGLDRLTPVRHALSHGTMGGYDAGAKVITFNKVNPDPTRSFHAIEEIRISVENIERSADVSTQLATDLGAFASDLMDEFTGE